MLGTPLAMTSSGPQEKKCQALESERWVYGSSLKHHAMLHEKGNNNVPRRMPNGLLSVIRYASKNSRSEKVLPQERVAHSFGSSYCLLGWYEFTLSQSLSRGLVICVSTS